MTAAAPPPALSREGLARRRALYARAAAGAALAIAAAAALALHAASRVAPAHALWAWLALEVAFVFVWVDKLHRFSAQPPEQQPSGHDGVAVALRFKGLRKYFAFSDRYLKLWFRDADKSLIRRGNVLELLSYGFWYSTADQVTARGDMPFLDSLLSLLQSETGIQLEEGYTPGLRYMSHLWDALPASYRPLVFYAFTESLGALTRAMLWAAGFRRHDVCGRGYYTLEAAPWSGPASAGGQRGAPVLFLHGVGGGVLPYLGVIFNFAASGRAIIAPEYRHCSMRLTDDIPTVEDLAHAAHTFMAAMGHERAHIVGHSYGSLVASRLVQLHPDAAASLTLLDPVCFGMFMPPLLYNFLYARPCSGSLLQDLGMYLVSRELHMTATFCRRFMWSDYNLWPEHLPANLLVMLSGQDLLSQADDILAWLTAETRARVLFDPEARHGCLLMRPDRQARVLAEWLDMAAGADARAAAGAPAPALRRGGARRSSLGGVAPRRASVSFKLEAQVLPLPRALTSDSASTSSDSEAEARDAAAAAAAARQAARPRSAGAAAAPGGAAREQLLPAAAAAAAAALAGRKGQLGDSASIDLGALAFARGYAGLGDGAAAALPAGLAPGGARRHGLARRRGAAHFEGW
ncbi:hypothetical protein Rsub_10384 [Raphidocelis subcapitata]|uniref:AB hydrolase-1 domain-containing protein n=1 Tax=Raphidocelis subcapitata TaxID=307507 RepID=A0A2V0PC81_9CHLO|nr:hypothetical protein Rsub_10384 [Raphidocelis subcapitata]|eukprot:GBF97461.1 hypothetical protein Rsub_10384 [Raphidocelis subcapitata]